MPRSRGLGSRVVSVVSPAHGSPRRIGSESQPSSSGKWLYWYASDGSKPGMPVGAWMRAIQTVPRVEVLPLTAEIAVQADELEMHADPADRFIAASALQHGVPLVSKDRLLRSLRFIETIW